MKRPQALLNVPCGSEKCPYLDRVQIEELTIPKLDTRESRLLD
jgi:hypothetical protein